MKITLDNIFRIASEKRYRIYTNETIFNYNLNIWGFRSTDRDTIHFNDMFAVFYQDMKNVWHLELFEGTTDPSNILLADPMNEDGTAILVPGQHIRLWTFGYHKGRKDHKALIQYSPCRVFRDNNKDNVIDDNLPIFEGMFGINMHRANAYKHSDVIGLHSAGCQVHEDVDKYNKTFIPLVTKCCNEGNKLFTYTLCEEKYLK